MIKIPKDMISGTIFNENKYGAIEVIEYINSNKVAIRVLDSSFVKFTSSRSIRNGGVRCPFYKSVFGVGFTGNGAHKSGYGGVRSKPYEVWYCMMQRCYQESCKEYYYYGGRGVKVCDEWHNFQNFAEWHLINYPNDGNEYHLDKDTFIHGNKIYSPKTCGYIEKHKNIQAARASYYKVTSPSGDVSVIYNMARFCRPIGLNSAKMCRVAKGCAISHKGWKAEVSSRDEYESN